MASRGDAAVATQDAGQRTTGGRPIGGIALTTVALAALLSLVAWLPAERSNRPLGLAPYEIDGVLYVPEADPDYDEVGIASWYGPTFHGRRTANGETFDMNRVSAAHPTLPLGTRVKVTNLDNGRSTILRINDRGPFVDRRLIDLSRRAAEILGFRREGLARVRVQVLALPI